MDYNSRNYKPYYRSENSHGGAWLLFQKLGERIYGAEIARVKEMDVTGRKGKKEMKLLFKEMGGVWSKYISYDA